MRQTKRKKSVAGFSLVELLVVLGLGAIVIGMAIHMFYGYQKGKRMRVDSGVQGMKTAITEARANGINGIEDVDARTFDPQRVHLSEVVSILPTDGLKMPFDAPQITKIIFEPQTGKGVPPVDSLGIKKSNVAYGWVVLDSQVEKDRIAMFVPYQPGPILLYRWTGKEWSQMKTALY